MKLSDVKGERTLDVLCELVEPVANLVEDEEVRTCLAGDGELSGKLKKAIPTVLDGHRGDVVAILSTIAGVAPEEYLENMTLKSLIADVYELMTDEVFADFLASGEDGDGPGTC